MSEVSDLDQKEHWTDMLLLLMVTAARPWQRWSTGCLATYAAWLTTLSNCVDCLHTTETARA